MAIVTGGTRGIGLSMAEGLAAAGAKIAVASRKEDACERVEAHLCSMGGGAIGVPTRVGEIDSLNALVNRSVERFGRIDIVGLTELPTTRRPCSPCHLANSHQKHGKNPSGPTSAA